MSLVIAQCFWLSLPVVLAGILHMVVVKKDWLAFLKKPIDGGATIRGERVFGDNKTWRGFVVMIGLSALIGATQGFFGGAWAQRSHAMPASFDDRVGQSLTASIGPNASDNWIRCLPDTRSLVLVYAGLSAVLGLGYALGELPNSFLKRRVKIQPGKTGSGAIGAFFFLLDQADSVIAALGLGLLVFRYPLEIFVVGSVALTLVHLALNATLYVTNVRKNL